MDFSSVSKFYVLKNYLLSGNFRSITYNSCHFYFSVSESVWEYYKRHESDV